VHVNGNDHEDTSFNEDTALSLVDRLSTIKLPHISDDSLKGLSSLIAQAGFIVKQQKSVDEFALLYLAELPGLMNDALQTRTTPSQASWRKICWAYHSNSEEILIDITARQYKGQLHWQNARDCGMFMWMTDLAALVSRARLPSCVSLLTSVSEHNSKSLRGTNTPRPMRRIPSTALCITLR